MDILDDNFGATPEPVQDMSSLVETQPLGTYVPMSATRNRAATTALLTGAPSDMVEKYRLMMKEEEAGTDVTYQQASDSLAQANKGKSMKHIISILGDNSIPLEQKKRLMNLVQTGGFKEEGAITLQTQGLTAPSKGESVIGENARISTASMMAEMQKEREDRQKQMNGFMASLPEQDLGQMAVNVASAEALPFGRNIIAAKVSATTTPTTIGGWVKNLLLPGSTKGDIQDKLNNIPPEDRPAFTQKLLQSIKDSASVFPSDNYYAQYKTAVELLDSPIATTSERWVDNAMTLLDAFWVGSEFKGAKGVISAAEEAASKARRPGSAKQGTSDVPFNEVHKADWELVQDPHNPFAARIGEPKKALPAPAKAADDAKRIEMNSVVRRENPVSPYSVIENSNPASAREMHSAIISGTDEIAEALTGVNREQAIINNVYPQIATDSENVLSKVNQDITEAVTNTGATRYTPEEFTGAIDQVTNDFRNASGLEINDAMTTFRTDGDHLNISAHYSTAGGSFTTAAEAKAQAQFALRGYGIKDEEITVLKRTGIDYAPVSLADDTQGDYIVRVETKHAISDSEVVNWNPLDVKKNWTDRITQTGSENRGNVSGWLFDPGSMLHPTITGSASIAADQSIVLENILLKPIRELRTELSALPKNRIAAVEDYIREANTKGIKFDTFNLMSRGFSQPEIDSLAKWKDIWDGHFYLENFDLVRTLNSQGFKLFENQNTKLFAKNVPKNQNIGRVYDPATDSVVTLSKDLMDDLYTRGGSYASLRRPVTMNGVSVDHMIVRNTPSEFLRGIRDTDSVLNYRDGYYTVNYLKGSRFIDQIVVDAAGKEVRTTVGVAGNTADAERFKNQQQQLTGNRHEIREDSRGFKKDGDGYWDLHSASGRISQRMRGKPLESPIGINQLGTGVHVENPMESAVRAARSLGGRTVSRPMLETAKQRFISQYGDLLPNNEIGGKSFPSNRNEIVDHVSHTSSRAADARTTYGYIRYLEQGYINSADEIFKGGMNVVADILGKYKLSGAEVMARKVGDIAPSHALKSTVFHAYISMSLPIRQWLVQAHQAQRMVAYNPKGFLNGGVESRLYGYLSEKAGLISASQATKDFVKFVDESGMIAGVDRNSLVRGLGLDMADSSSGFKRVVGEVTSLPQRAGFDVGEKINMLGHLAAVHEKHTREGINLLDKTKRDLALIEVRALSYDLNKAGDLAYTQSSPAMILQFLQMPQKAWLYYTNRKIPTDAKLRTAAWDLIMYGSPKALVTSIMLAVGADGNDVMPDNPELRSLYVSGLEATLYNKALSNISGEQVGIDFSSLQAYDLDGWAKMYHSLTNDGAFAALAASPAGQLFALNGTNMAKKNGRIPQAMLTMGRYFNIVEDIDPQDPTKFSAVVSDVAKITSGWTAASNALVMLEIRKKRDASGTTIDSDVSLPEVGAAFLGFGTKATKELYETSKAISDNKKAHEEDVMKRYRDILQYYASTTGTDNADIAHIQQVSSILMTTFNNPTDRNLVVKQWQKDMVGKGRGVLKQMLDSSTLPNGEKSMAAINSAPIDQETKNILIERHKAVKSLNLNKE